MAERNREVALLPYNCMGVVRSMMSSIDNIIISQGGKVTHDIFAKGVAERKWVFEFGPCTTCSLLLRAFMVHARLTRLALCFFFLRCLTRYLVLKPGGRLLYYHSRPPQGTSYEGAHTCFT